MRGSLVQQDLGLAVRGQQQAEVRAGGGHLCSPVSCPTRSRPCLHSQPPRPSSFSPPALVDTSLWVESAPGADSGLSLVTCFGQWNVGRSVPVLSLKRPSGCSLPPCPSANPKGQMCPRQSRDGRPLRPEAKSYGAQRDPLSPVDPQICENK